MTALVAVGLAGATAQLNIVKSHRMKELERQWTEVHSSDLESQLLAEQKRMQRRWFIGVAVGLFLAGNVVLIIADMAAKKPETLEPESLDSTNPSSGDLSREPPR